jgi:hypothetical protein
MNPLLWGDWSIELDCPPIESAKIINIITGQIVVCCKSIGARRDA